MKWSPEDWARLGAEIRKARERYGYSRKRLSELSGVSEKSIQLAEEGRVPTRWPKSIDALAEVLGWIEESAQYVLDGGVPLWANPLFKLPGGDASVEKIPADEARPLTENLVLDHFLDRYGVKSKDLPNDIAAMIPMIAQFSNRCSGAGASKELAMSFDGMASIMLAEVAQAHQEKLRREEKQTPEEIELGFAETRRRINRQSVSLREIVLKRLEEARAVSEGTPGRETIIRSLERGLLELEEVIEDTTN